jgi:hypothetical protein
LRPGQVAFPTDHLRRGKFAYSCNAGILTGAALAAAVAQELKPKDMPPPRSEGGQSLTAALKLRRSMREYSDRPLPAQVLSDLLWAAFDVNRPGE